MKLFLGIFLLLAIGCSGTFAQDTSGRLEGRIVDQNGAAIRDANINVQSEALLGVRGTTTTSSGWFQVPALPVGVYQLRISHVSYHTVKMTDVRIYLGKTISVGEIRMQQRELQIPDMIVSAAKPVIDLTSTELGGNLTANAVSQLPVERNYRSLAVLLPQVNYSYLGDEANVAGATGCENKYFVNGMDVTEPFFGATATNLPYNFVQEVEIKSDGYQAEYRSALGGIVNVITYSGGNEFHGQVFGFFTNKRFAAEPREAMLAPPAGSYRQYDAGFRLGGPVLRDRLWFFAAYNPSIDRENVWLPGLGYYADRSTIHSFAGKLTWQANNRNNLVLTVFGDPQIRRAVGETGGTPGNRTPTSFLNSDPFLENIRRGGANFAVNGHHTLTSKLLLETNGSVLSSNNSNTPATARGEVGSFYVDQNGVWSGGVPWMDQVHSTVVALGVKASYVAGQHVLKAGLEYCNNKLKEDATGTFLYQIGEASYFQALFRTKGSAQNRIAGGFLQDSWQANKRLTINAGLRWEGQYFIDSNGKMAQDIANQFQPRLGFVFQPGEMGQQKIFASYGRYFQNLSTNLDKFYFIIGASNRFLWYDHDPRISAANIADSSSSFTTSRPALTNLSGQYYDAFSLGYERQLAKSLRMGVYGTYHTLREGIEDGVDPITGDSWFHNPGKGVLALFPKVKREYTAFEVRLENPFNGKAGFMASYVLSRTFGNYSGLFNSDFNWPFPNTTGSFDILEILDKATGLLPNDRTHSLKFSGSYKLLRGLQAGVLMIWQSGTPLSEFGGAAIGFPYHRFMRQRGTAGRTPALWDLNLRVAYELGEQLGFAVKPRLLLDIFHLASRRTPVNYDQVHYNALDENGQNIDPNPLYGQPIRFQPPMSLRLGMETNF